MKCSCPRCDAVLRLADSIRAGKRIACPSCQAVFRVRQEPSSAAAIKTSPITTAAPASEERPQLPQRRFPPRKRFQPKKQSVNPALIVIPIAVGAMLLLGGVVLAVVLVRNKDKRDSVAKASTTNTSREGPQQNSGGGGFPGARPQPEQGAGPGQLVPGSSGLPGNPPVEQPNFPQPTNPQLPPQPPPITQPPPPPPSEPVIGIEVGNIAPEIEGEDIDCKKFKMGDYRGKVILLDFWGYW